MTQSFERWVRLECLRLADLPRYGDFAAVYAFRDVTVAEVLKYGHTECLRERIFGNYFGGIGGVTTKRIHDKFFAQNMIGRIEVSWIEAKDKTEAQRKETEFRKAYKKDKGERPAWDLKG